MNWRQVRAWIYRVAALIGVVYVAVGVATGDASTDELTAAIGAALTALAAKNTPTTADDETPSVESR